jgi:hypothetical protein
VLLPGGQGVVEALGLDGAAGADALGVADRGVALLAGEEEVRVARRTGGVPCPRLRAGGLAVAVRAGASAARGTGGLGRVARWHAGRCVRRGTGERYGSRC